jgi:hypothetical protein
MKTRVRLQEEAKARKSTRDGRSAEIQLQQLDKRLGTAAGAKKERERLNKIISLTAAKNSKKRKA